MTVSPYDHHGYGDNCPYRLKLITNAVNFTWRSSGLLKDLLIGSTRLQAEATLTVAYLSVRLFCNVKAYNQIAWLQCSPVKAESLQSGNLTW